MATCNICCEPLNQSTRKPITCFCDFSACKQCSEKYLLDILTDPHCMNCRKEWNREFLDAQFTKKFVSKDLKTRREHVLLDREKSMMPATQIYIERKKEADSLLTEIADINRKIKELQLAKMTLQARYYGLLHARNLNRPGASETKREFVRACPMTGCKGFLSTQWKCGVCDNWTCPECHEPKGLNRDVEHQCNPDMLATAKLLNKDSQPCPQCGAMCTKVDGCDQVFAMCCGTTFNWRTGKVDKGPIHAPDYYRWLERNGRQIPRNPGDMPCGGMPYAQQVRNVGATLDEDMNKKLINAYRLINHITTTERNKYNAANRGEAENRDIRMQYMTNTIDEDHFKTLLQQREKAKKKKGEIYDVLSTVMLAGVDIYQRLCATKDKEVIAQIFLELDNLQVYSNEAMSRISKRYACVTPRIDDWQTIKYVK